MTTMKAVRIRRFGGPEVLELADLEKPQPSPDNSTTAPQPPYPWRG